MSGVKHRINDEMNNTINSISTDIVSLFSGNPSALILANIFLATSRSVIDSLLSWVKSFYLELQAGDQSCIQDAWLLVCSCGQCYFKELGKVRAPAQTASNQKEDFDKDESYLQAMAQAHRVSAEFIQHRWREHPSIAGVINYHLFQFMVPILAHKKLQDEMVALKKIMVATQSEVSKISSRISRLDKSLDNLWLSFLLLVYCQVCLI